MRFTYIQYADFEHRVKAIVGIDHYNNGKYQLPHVGLLLRQRFLDSLEYCGDIAKSIQVLDSSKSLPEKHFRRFLSYICQ